MSLSFSGYDKLNEERNKLAEENTGATGYSKARNFGNESMKNMIRDRMNRAPVSYGEKSLSNYLDAIQDINPSLYDTYNSQKDIQEANIESKNKQVGEARERDKRVMDEIGGHVSNILDFADKGLQLKLGNINKRKEENNMARNSELARRKSKAQDIMNNIGV